MSNYIEYNDKIAFHPGYYIKEIIEESGLLRKICKTIRYHAKEFKYSGTWGAKLINRYSMKLSRMLGTSVEYWLNLQKSYDALIAEFELSKELEKERRIFKYFQYTYFRENFGLPDLPRKINEQIKKNHRGVGAKATGFACRITGKQGVTLAGQIALKIDPDILKELSGQVKEKIFVTCGTNGKTTTNNLLCSAIEAEGKKVVCNHTGSNMLNGVAAAFAQNASLSGNLKADYACIEVDEASTVRIFPHFKPDYIGA